MGRAKATMELISNKKSRRVTYEKRRKGLEKKAHELSTLCAVKVGLIMYGPKETNNSKPLELNIWPENNSQDILTLINSYKEGNIEDRRRRTTDLNMFYRDRKKKAEEEFAKLHKKNIEDKHPTWDHHYDNLTSEELRQFGGLLESKLEAMRARLDFMKGTQTYFADSASAAGGCGPSGMTGGSIDHHSHSQLQSQDHQNPYIVQNLFKRSSMQLEIIQQQPLAAFTLQTQQCGGSDVTVQNSFNSLANTKSMMLMNDGGGSNSSSMYSNDKSMATYNQPVLAPLPECVVGTQVEAPLQYYIPAMQPMPVFVQYPLQPKGSTQIYKAPMEEYYHQMGDFTYMSKM